MTAAELLAVWDAVMGRDSAALLTSAILVPRLEGRQRPMTTNTDARADAAAGIERHPSPSGRDRGRRELPLPSSPPAWAETPSTKDDWETPGDLYGRWHGLFHFDLDAAANATNRKCETWLGPGSPDAEDALAVEWAKYGSYIWLNPPYGRKIGAFLERAEQAANRGAVVVGLIPARVDTQWWHRFVGRGAFGPVTVHFLRGRVQFVGATAGAKFPSAIVIWWPTGVDRGGA